MSQDTRTCPRLCQPRTQGFYMGKSAFQAPAWLLWTIPLSSLAQPYLLQSRVPPGRLLCFGSPHAPARPGQRAFQLTTGTQTTGRDCTPVLPSSVLPRVFSCCPHRFAEQVLLGTGLGSLLQWRVCLGPGNWKRVFFINNKLTVIAFSTTAAPPPGEVPSHASPCDRHAPSCARRSALPQAQGSKPGATLPREGAKTPSPTLASV